MPLGKLGINQLFTVRDQMVAVDGSAVDMNQANPLFAPATRPVDSKGVFEALAPCSATRRWSSPGTRGAQPGRL